MAVKPIPEGYHTVTPYLIVLDAAQLIDFLKQAFDAQESVRMARPDGRIAHAEVRIGDSVVMMCDAGDETQNRLCMTDFYVYVPDADAAYQRALQAGATSVREPANQYYGDRSGGVKDPFGNDWWIATKVEVVPPEEIAEAFMKQQSHG